MKPMVGVSSPRETVTVTWTQLSPSRQSTQTTEARGEDLYVHGSACEENL
jgi:hypothetical protein